MADERLSPEWLARVNRLATVSALLSTTIHEVNNALQVISGSAEMIGPGIAPDVLARRSDAIGGQARRASALLAELSSFARDDTPPLVRADLGHVGQRALAMRQYTLARLNIQSAFESSGPLPQVAAAPRIVFQIVVNLLLNAERALAGRSDGRVVVSLREANGRVELTVGDNGAGVDPAEVGRLFELRIGESLPGLGIGLAVGRMLAEQEGGVLSYAPSPLGGAAFTLSFPAKPF